MDLKLGDRLQKYGEYFEVLEVEPQHSTRNSHHPRVLLRRESDDYTFFERIEWLLELGYTEVLRT